MQDIKEYIKRPKGERTKHLNLSEACVERGGNSTRFHGVLAQGLDTTIPEKKRDGVNVYLCHACHNGKCSNVKHLYWGTPTENVRDNIANGHFISAWHATIAKHGSDRALEMMRDAQRIGCVLGGKASAKKRRR